MNGTVNYEYLRYSLDEASTNIWLMASTGMIFFMQSGFALLECGSIREKNA
jgi:ammonia channel protein AmtB